MIGALKGGISEFDNDKRWIYAHTWLREEGLDHIGRRIVNPTNETRDDRCKVKSSPQVPTQSQAPEVALRARRRRSGSGCRAAVANVAGLGRGFVPILESGGPETKRMAGCDTDDDDGQARQMMATID